jgi:hypothetical protein
VNRRLLSSLRETPLDVTSVADAADSGAPGRRPQPSQAAVAAMLAGTITLRLRDA